MKKIFLAVLLIVLSVGCNTNSSVLKISTNNHGTFDAIKWSPDGKQLLAFFVPSKAREHSALLVYDVDDAKWKEIKDLGSAIVAKIDWLNNQTFVYENGGVVSPGSGSSEIYSQLFFYNLVTGAESHTGRGSSVVDMCVDYASHQLMLVRQLPTQIETYGITTLDPDTMIEKVLYTPPLGQSADEVACSPDGKSVVFTLTKKNPGASNRVHVYSLNTLDLSNNTPTSLIDFSDLTIDSISWTKDNKIMARVIDNNYNRAAALISLDGKQQPLDLHGVDPVIIDPSPTEDKLAVTSLGYPGFNSVYIIKDYLLMSK
ncbi:MAG TPA: hypothetical protein VHM28_09315 [Anaerolineales bacterium]|nr:hypothetical protein [Anaerolineales bacterium]